MEKHSHNPQVLSRGDGVPLVLVAGFLGAGKTSLLLSLIPKLIERDARPVVVINDFQNAQVDAERLRQFQIAVAPVSGSCVCCGSRDQLLDCLEQFELTEKTVLLVEANGTTDTANLIELLTLDRRALRYSYPVQICVIDAKRWGKRMFYNFLEEAQLQTASYVAVSRRDQVKPERWKQVLEQIALCNPRAQQLETDSLVEKITTMLRQKSDSHKAAKSPCSATEHPHPHDGTHSHEHHEHSHEDHHFASLEALLPPVVTKEQIECWLESLPDSVLRVKGLAKLEPEGWHVFEMVQDVREIFFHPVKGEPKIFPRAVLIAPRLAPQEIIHSLQRTWPEQQPAIV